MTPRDIEILARTLYGEARGEPWEGKIAVAWVVRNRVETDIHSDGKPDWWGEGYEAVCLKPAQFTCWSDHNRAALESVTPDDPVFRDCLAASAAVMSGLVPDPTAGATHYCNPALADPDWAKAATKTARIGGHVFYKDVG